MASWYWRALNAVRARRYTASAVSCGNHISRCTTSPRPQPVSPTPMSARLDAIACTDNCVASKTGAAARSIDPTCSRVGAIMSTLYAEAASCSSAERSRSSTARDRTSCAVTGPTNVAPATATMISLFPNIRLLLAPSVRRPEPKRPAGEGERCAPRFLVRSVRVPRCFDATCTG